MTPDPVDKTPHAHIWLQLSYSPHIHKYILNTHSDITLSPPLSFSNNKYLVLTKKRTKCHLTSDFVSFSRGKKVDPEMMEPQGLKGKRCVLIDI